MKIATHTQTFIVAADVWDYGGQSGGHLSADDGLGRRDCRQPRVISFNIRAVTIQKNHDLVPTLVFKSQFNMFFGIAGLKLYFYSTLIFLVDLI